jgi:polyisoprenoid-binding protein YceI
MRRIAVILCIAAVLTLAGLYLPGRNVHPTQAETVTYAPTLVAYRIDPKRSKFMVNADRTGLAYFKGQSHRIAVRDFSGEASLTTDVLNPASLSMTIKANSLEETDPVFTPEQKKIIKKELDGIVLESEKYPEITFKSTDVTGTMKNGAFDVKIGGDLTLHGVTRHIVIPAAVTLNGDTMRATGEFELNRKKYGVNATNAFHGTVRVKHDLKFIFDIIGERI